MKLSTMSILIIIIGSSQKDFTKLKTLQNNDYHHSSPFRRDPLANLDLQVNRETQAYRYTSIFISVLPNESMPAMQIRTVRTKHTVLPLNKELCSSFSGFSWSAGAYRSARREGKLHKSCFISILKH